MDSLLQRKEFASCLIDVISLGINHDRLEDAETVLTAVRGLRPRLAELDTFDAWIGMKRGQWAEAIRLLRNVDASATNWWLGKALLAFCQFATGDVAWNATANDVVFNSDSPEAIGLVRLLLHPDEAHAPPTETTPTERSPLETASMVDHRNYLRA